MCIVQDVETKSVFTCQPIKQLVSTTVRSAKPAVTFWIFLLRTKNRQICCLAVMIHIVLQERRFATRKKKNYPRFWRIFSANLSHPHQKKLNPVNPVQIWNRRIRFLLVEDLSHNSIFKSSYSASIYSQPVKVNQLTENLEKIIMTFSVSNNGIQWALDFCPDYVTIIVKYLNQNITTSSQGIPLAAWQLLLSERQKLLDNHLPRVPITQNQKGTMEMRDEVLYSLGAQDLDTSSYQVSDLEDIEFNWEDSQLDMHAVFRPGIDSPFSPTTFDVLSMGGPVENPIVLDEEEHKNSPLPSTVESVRPMEPPRLQRSRPFGSRIENVPDYIYRSLLQ